MPSVLTFQAAIKHKRIASNTYYAKLKCGNPSDTLAYSPSQCPHFEEPLTLLYWTLCKKCPHFEVPATVIGKLAALKKYYLSGVIRRTYCWKNLKIC